MDSIQVILDKRIPLKLLQVSEGENIIYCKSFRDDLFNTGSFSTKDKDFVHNYILEKGQMYIVTDVKTNDGKLYKNIKFKVIIENKQEIPYSQFNPNNPVILDEKKDPIQIKKEEPLKKPVINESEKQKEKNKKDEIEKNILLENKKEEEVKKYLSSKEGDNIKVILDRRVPLNVLRTNSGQNIIFCKNVKDQLFNSASFSTKDKDFVHNYILEKGERYIITDVNTQDDKTYKNVKFKVILVKEGELPYSVFDPSNTQVINEVVILPEEKVVLEAFEVSKATEEEILQLKETHKKLEKQKQKIIREKERIDKQNQLLKEEHEKALLEKQEKDKELRNKLNIIKETKDEIISSSKKYLEEKIKVVSEENKSFARRILDLGGGGGSVATQFANGGTMNGNLNVTGQYLSGGINLLNIFSGGGGGDAAVNALVHSSSANWNSTYSTVYSNSASWGTGGVAQTLSFNDSNAQLSISFGNTISLSALSGSGGGGGGGDPAVNALVYSSSAYWNNAYTNLVYNSAAYLSGTNVNLGDIPSLSSYWNEAYTNLIYNSANYLSAYDMSLVNANSANWNNTYTQYSSNSASYATIGFVNGKFLPLSGGSITGNLVIQGSLTALGTSTFANTIFTTTSALSVINTGPGPALYVYQAAGPYDVASFYDGDGVEVLHIGNANPGGNGFVGINESFPAVELSVRGAISASKTITALGGNSDQWNSSYAITNTNSGRWESSYTTLNTVSSITLIDGGNTRGANIAVGARDAYNVTLRTNNANRVWILSSGEVGIGPSLASLVNLINSSSPNSPRLTVSGPISCNNVITVADGNSNLWNSNYTTTRTNSASWSEAYTNLITNSGAYLSGVNISLLAAASGSWNSVYTTVNSNSGNYILDGGNTKGANILIGTNDNYNLILEINGNSKLLLTSDTLSGNSNKISFGAGSATGLYSFAEATSRAFGDYSHAEGQSTLASGYASHTEGQGTSATFVYCHAEGENTLASGYGAHAEGVGSIASAGSTHAEGNFTVASFNAAHSEGDRTTASGYASHSEGILTRAVGEVSHAAGGYSVAAHSRTWIWKGDTNIDTISTTRTDQFMVSAAGGIFFPGNVGIRTNDNTNALSLVGTISTNAHKTSQEWNTAYTNLVYNSTAYLSAYNMSLINSNSGYWNDAYTNLVSNSSNYLSGASISYVNTNFVKLSGDIMTGSLSAIMLSGGQIFSSGNLRVLGDGTFNRIQATIKNFYIEHPTVPGKHLQYSSLESPYIGVRLTGEDVVKNGKCIVLLPEYTKGLISEKDVHVFLTNYGHSKVLYVDSININQNQFTVKCDGLTNKWNEYKFFWSLTGVRKDVPNLEVEV